MAEHLVQALAQQFARSFVRVNIPIVGALDVDRGVEVIKQHHETALAFAQTAFNADVFGDVGLQLGRCPDLAMAAD